MTRRMVARHSNYDETKDFIPTPPWATRALFEYVVDIPLGSRVLEPAAGGGHMARTIEECGHEVMPFDIVDYGVGFPVRDFLEFESVAKYDYVITNPPYKLGRGFFHRARAARRGVALLLRIQWLTGMGGRWQIFLNHPPTSVAVFAARISMAAGKVVRNNNPYFDHAWFWWDFEDPRRGHAETELLWIPPDAQQKLERDEDYA